MTILAIGDRVRVHLDSRVGVAEGWYPGTVFRIDPYSRNRSFFWVELDPQVRAALGIGRISVLNPQHIQKLEDPV